MPGKGRRKNGGSGSGGRNGKGGNSPPPGRGGGQQQPSPSSAPYTSVSPSRAARTAPPPAEAVPGDGRIREPRPQAKRYEEKEEEDAPLLQQQRPAPPPPSSSSSSSPQLYDTTASTTTATGRPARGGGGGGGGEEESKQQQQQQQQQQPKSRSSSASSVASGAGSGGNGNGPRSYYQAGGEPPGVIGESNLAMEEGGAGYHLDELNRRIEEGVAAAAAVAVAGGASGGPTQPPRLAGTGTGGGGGGGGGNTSSALDDPSPPRMVVVCPSTFGSNSGASDISPLTSKTGGHASWARQMTMLILISVLPFGGHFVKNCLTSLEVYLVEDPRLHLSETRYGLLLSMTSLPNFFIPFLGGVFLDKRGHRFATLLFLFLVLIGQVLFTIAIQLGSFELAMAGRVVLGLGEGSVVVAQRAVISHVFTAKSQVTFAVGVSVAMACLSKTLSRATVVPASEFLGGYIGGLWYTVIVCLLSTLAGVLFIILSDEREDPFERRRNKSVSFADSFLGSAIDVEGTGSGMAPSLSPSHTPTYRSMVALRETAWTLSGSFWALCVLHSIYINVFHIFLNFSSHYFMVQFGKDAATAAYLTSSASVLVIFLGPLVGYIMDRMGGQLYVCSATSLLVVAAYYALSYTQLPPLYDILLISVGESFIPILVMALIPFTVPKRTYGTAFGIVEVSGAVCSFAGNVLVGYLLDRAHGEYGPAMFTLTVLAATGSLCFLALTFYEYCCGHKGLNTRHAIDYESLAGLDE